MVYVTHRQPGPGLAASLKRQLAGRLQCGHPGRATGDTAEDITGGNEEDDNGKLHK